MAWRRPSLLIVYTRSGLDLDTLGLVDAQGRDDANVIVRDPSDQSVYAAPDPSVELRGVDVPLADPTQMLWDLQDLGGADRLEERGGAAMAPGVTPLRRARRHGHRPARRPRLQAPRRQPDRQNLIDTRARLHQPTARQPPIRRPPRDLRSARLGERAAAIASPVLPHTQSG